MIDINLLPVELRPVDRTPLPRLMAILSGVLIVVMEAFFLVFFFVQWIPTERDLLVSANEEIESLKKFEDQYFAIERKIEEINTRKQDIGKLYDDRFVWARLLDRLADQVVLPDRVWIESLEFDPPKVRFGGGAAAPGANRGTLRLKCFARPEVSGGQNARAEMMDEMNRFISRIRDDKELGHGIRGLADMLGEPRLTSFEIIDTPARSGPKSEIPEDAPMRVLNFTLEVDFKPKEEKQG